MKKKRFSVYASAIGAVLLAVLLLGPFSPFPRFRLRSTISLELSESRTELSKETIEKQGGYSLAADFAFVNRSLPLVWPNIDSFPAVLTLQQDASVRFEGTAAQRKVYSVSGHKTWGSDEAIRLALLVELPEDVPCGVYDLHFSCFGKKWTYSGALKVV